MDPNNHLGRHFQARRLELGLSLGEVARRLGYANVSKGARRVLALEEVGQCCTQEFLVKLMGVLGVDRAVVQELLDRDRAEYVEAWEQWVSEPVPITVVRRLVPGMYGIERLPADVTTPEQAIAFGQELARTTHARVYVELSRRVTVVIDEQGEVTARVEATPDSDPRPFTLIGNKPIRFELGASG